MKLAFDEQTCYICSNLPEPARQALMFDSVACPQNHYHHILA